MSYEPTVWKDGDLVTSAKLNKIEQGIASHNVIEAIIGENIITLNKTWQEIWDNNYTNVMYIYEVGDNSSTKQFAPIIRLEKAGDNSSYLVAVRDPLGEQTFTCDSPDDHPSEDTSLPRDSSEPVTRG